MALKPISQSFHWKKCLTPKPVTLLSECSYIMDTQSIDLRKKAYIEVRDSRTGYFIPVRYGLGVWPDKKIVGASPSSASSGDSGRHSGQGTIFGVCPDGIGSWWKLWTLWDLAFGQNWHTFHMGRVVWPGEPIEKKNSISIKLVFKNGHAQKK